MLLCLLPFYGTSAYAMFNVGNYSRKTSSVLITSLIYLNSCHQFTLLKSFESCYNFSEPLQCQQIPQCYVLTDLRMNHGY